jgi:hypothetical protein
MRSEAGGRATIVDLDADRVTFIDDRQKTYSTISLADMRAALANMGRSARQEGTAKSDGGDGQLDIKPTVSFERTGEKATIAGYGAERTFLTVTMQATEKATDSHREHNGTIVLLVDTWVAKDAPHARALQEFQRAYAEKVGQTFSSFTDMLRAAFAGDERMRSAFDAAAKQMQGVGGAPVRTTTYWVAVPEGATFDRAATLQDQHTSVASDTKQDIKTIIANAKDKDKLKEAIAEAKAGKKQDQKQMTVMTVHEDVQSVTTGAVSDALFAPPAGYRETKRR